jgi:hypothetical protein
MSLRQEFEEETGLRRMVPAKVAHEWNPEYVEWLEKRIEELEAENRNWRGKLRYIHDLPLDRPIESLMEAVAVAADAVLKGGEA